MRKVYFSANRNDYADNISHCNACGSEITNAKRYMDGTVYKECPACRTRTAVDTSIESDHDFLKKDYRKILILPMNKTDNMSLICLAKHLHLGAIDLRNAMNDGFIIEADDSKITEMQTVLENIHIPFIHAGNNGLSVRNIIDLIEHADFSSKEKAIKVKNIIANWRKIASEEEREAYSEPGYAEMFYMLCSIYED